MRVLLVDDSKIMRTVQKKALESLGPVEFSEAADGLEALALIAAAPAPFDLMLVDWNMPNMDGITLVGKVRETDKRTPMLMCTTEAEKQRVIEAIKAGVNNYVIKPFTPESLMEKIRKVLPAAA
jgi:two-component system chemotaxis response regulator CheY